MNSNGSKFRPPGAGLFTVMGNDPVVAPFARLARIHESRELTTSIPLQ